MIKAISESQLNVIRNNENLSRYLDNLSSGKKATERSWLWENREPEEVRDSWLNILASLKNGSTFEKRVFEFDTAQLEKWGPQGEVSPLDEILEEIVLPTFKLNARPKRLDTWWSSEWQRALQAVALRMRQRHIRSLYPASLKRVLENMRTRDTLESNSGWPDFRRRNLPEVKSAALAAASSQLWKTYPAIALFRNYNLKTRLVWMFPMAANLKEGSFFLPLQTAILKGDVTKFYAPWVGFEEVRKLITDAYASGKYVYATDFSKTDEHFGFAATEQVFHILAPLFAEQSARDDLYESLQRMHTIPLVISPTHEIVGRHGVASGSNWTNFIETVFDEIFAEYVSEFLPVKGLYAIGDDMAWISDSFQDAFPEHAEALGQEVGQIVNAEKVTAKPDYVKTLQRLFQRGYSRPDGLLRGVYSTIRALKSSIYPEKFHKPKDWSSDMFCARQFMILENCVDHPLFEEFVKFVVPGQKDLIPFARKGRAELDRILRETRLLPGFNPTYNQERKGTSLADFKSIAIAAKL